MSLRYSDMLSRRGFCACCLVAAGLGATGRWLKPAEAYAEARDIVDLIRDAAATAPLQTHKLRGGVAIVEGSGGNIAVCPVLTARFLSTPASRRHAPESSTQSVVLAPVQSNI